MKQLFFIFVFCLQISNSMVSADNQRFIIDGDLTGVKDSSKVYLVYEEQKTQLMDSCFIVNGKFRFQGTIESPIPAQLILNSESNSTDNAKKLNLHFYIEKGTIKVRGNNIISQAKVSETETNELLFQFEKEVEPIRQQAQTMQQQLKNIPMELLNNKLFADSINTRVFELKHQYSKTAFSFIKRHPNSIIGVYMLQSELKLNPDNLEIEPTFNSISSQIRNSTPGKELDKAIQSNLQIQIGGTPPDFAMTTNLGTPLKLSDLRGQYVFLSFWSPECSHCMEELPYLKQSYEAFKDKGFTILGVGILGDDQRQIWLDTIKRENLNWHNVSDFQYWSSEVNKQYKVNSTPTTFLLDPSGKIITKNIRGRNLMNTLDQIFK